MNKNYAIERLERDLRITKDFLKKKTIWVGVERERTEEHIEELQSAIKQLSSTDKQVKTLEDYKDTIESETSYWMDILKATAKNMGAKYHEEFFLLVAAAYGARERKINSSTDKVITNKELIKGAKEWIESRTDEEWVRVLEEENKKNDISDSTDKVIASGVVTGFYYLNKGDGESETLHLHTTNGDLKVDVSHMSEALELDGKKVDLILREVK